MPHSFGLRARTRDMFSQAFRKHGPVHMSTYLTTFKIGDYVDIKANGSIHKGMPHKFYHGKTGVVWNVTPRAVGVEVNKQVGHRIISKRIHVRIEHVRKSRCREDFLKRVKDNQAIRQDAKKQGSQSLPFFSLNSSEKDVPAIRRTPGWPKKGSFVKTNKTEIEGVVPLKYEFLV